MSNNKQRCIPDRVGNDEESRLTVDGKRGRGEGRYK
jgi:hypothetical protein